MTHSLIRILFSVASLLATVTSHASDRFTDEILCSPNTSSGFFVAVQSNATAWIKRISIRTEPSEKSEIGSFAVPVDQPFVSTTWDGSMYIAHYQETGLYLMMIVDDLEGKKLRGYGRISATLPNLFTPIEAELTCARN